MRYVNTRTGLPILIILLLIKMLSDLENIPMFLIDLGLLLVVSYILKQKIEEKFFTPMVKGGGNDEI